jgi:hypothetical protein
MSSIVTLQDLDNTNNISDTNTKTKQKWVSVFRTISDLNAEELEITELESQIQQFIYNDNACFCKFKYTSLEEKEKIELKVYTINPLHNEIFLMTQISEKEKKSCLHKTLLYLKKKIKSRKMYNYEVVWNNKGNKEYTTSYFWVNGIPELMDKFYEGEEKNEYDYTIYSIKMRPES